MGEYTVLDGAKALALPTASGQYLHVESTPGNTINWRSLDNDSTEWFTAAIPVEEVIANTPGNSNETYKQLITILHYAHLANQEILKAAHGFNVVTELTFKREWGLGTSSTLINNIAQWFKIDAYRLLWESFGGSGYDIACAQNNTPILYHLSNGKPVIEAIAFEPAFKDNLYFVYLNRKQNSRAAIAAYKSKRHNLQQVLANVNVLVELLINSQDLISFITTLEEHEQIMSQVLEIPAIKQTLFPDFTGTIKSLGAWGGDFVLAVSKDDPTEYFLAKGYKTIIPYKQMILNTK